MMFSLLRISLGATVLFKLFNAIYMEVIGKMMIIYSLIVISLIVFRLIYAPDVSFYFVVVLGLNTISWLFRFEWRLLT
jgi:hypothetical protein